MSARGGGSWKANTPYLAMLAPWIFGLVVFVLLPLLAVAALSLCRWDLFGTPVWVGLSNYRDIFTGDDRFLQSVRVTLLYTLLYVPTELSLIHI